MITSISRRNDPNKLYGFIIKKSPKLTLLSLANDFVFDGYAIIKNSTITSEIVTKSNEYVFKLMKKEGAWQRTPRLIKDLDITSWQSALANIKSVVILEDEKAGTFDIGPITRVGKLTCQIQNFNGVGEWTHLETIRYSKITICKFLDKYSLTHEKYLNRR